MIIKSSSPSLGEMRGSKFMFPVRVYYEDTDAGGIVYYANYLKFAERCRTEFIRHLGFEQNSDLQSQEKAGWVVKHCEIDYKSPAVLDDELTVSCEVIKLGGVTANMHQEIMRSQEVLASIDVRLAHISLSSKKPTPIPQELFERLK